MGIGRVFKISRRSVNLVIRELLQDLEGYFKIGLVVAEDWPTWDIILPSLGHQVLDFVAPSRFRKFLHGGTVSGTEWLPPNQERRLINLQYYCFFVSGNPSFVRQLWGGGISRDRTAFLMCVGLRFRNFRGIHGSWKLVHHHRVGKVTTAALWVGLGDAIGDRSMEDILICGVPRTLYTIWDTTSNLKTRGEVNS